MAEPINSPKDLDVRISELESAVADLTSKLHACCPPCIVCKPCIVTLCGSSQQGTGEQGSCGPVTAQCQPCAQPCIVCFCAPCHPVTFCALCHPVAFCALCHPVCFCALCVQCAPCAQCVQCTPCAACQGSEGQQKADDGGDSTK